MSSRSSIVPLLLFVIIASACDRAATVTSPDVALRAQHSRGGRLVPFRTSNYSFQITSSAPEAGCDGAGENRLHLSGEGTATQLGAYTVVYSFCSRAGGTIADGRGTFVAANGDLLHFTFDGSSVFVPPSSVNFTSFARFAGGSGRFEDARGEATVTGTVDVGTGAGSGDWNGTLSSVGSSE